MRTALRLAVCALLLTSMGGAARADSQGGVPVQANGRTLFTIRASLGSITAAERAAIANQKLEEILTQSPASIKTSLQKTDAGWVVRVNDRAIVSVTEGDAKAEGTAVDSLAQRWAAAIGHGLEEEGHSRTRYAFWKRVLLTSLIVAIALFLFLALRWGRRRITRGLEARKHRIRGLRVRELEILSSEKIARTVSLAFRTAYWIVLAVVIAGAALAIFGQFPSTKSATFKVLAWLLNPLQDIGRGILRYLPNLFYILVIVVVTRIALRAVSFIFAQVERGIVSLEPWIHDDVARPTGQIIKGILVVLALFFIAPLIPGTASTAARGISVILGLMVSFGSASTVGNAIAGIILTYMRPFRLAERVQVGQVTGDVIERTFLYIKLRTIKNEEVIVPSLHAISSPIINYSAKAQEPGLILHTSVTIGYDAPWRKVHELLLRAAEKTAHILKEPKPFVLQTALDDFFVSYQLNAYTDRPNEMQNIYSELHQNIQDSFNEGGVEILSPHYFQLRDGNTSSTPEQYRGAQASPRRMMVDVRLAGANS